MTTLPTYDDLMNPLLEALRKLGGSGSIEEIYAKTVEITGLPEEILAQLHEPEKSLTAEIIGAIRPSVDSHARSDAVGAGAHYVDNEASQLLSLCHPGAPVGALIGNFKSTNFLYRLAIACNPSCPPNLMAGLKNFRIFIKLL